MTIHIELTTDPIAIDRYADRLDDPDVGSHGWFVGTTRRTTSTGDRTTITETLDYHANESMAQVQLRDLATSAKQQFALTHVVIVHRLGNVPVGSASVLVGCSSPHRRQTFDALPWIMDTLKRDVPIWKRETDDDGDRHWVHPGLPT